MPSSGSTRHHSTPKRYTPRPSEASNATSSGYRCTWSIAAPLGSTTLVPARVSHPHQSAFVLSPSTWCAPVAVEHPVPAYGVRVTGPSEEDPDRSVTLAYTGDTDTCPGLDQLARGADVLLAEASFLEGRDLVRGIHLTGRRAGEAAERGQVGRLVVTHVPAWNDSQDAVAEARAMFSGPVLAAYPGMVVAL